MRVLRIVQNKPNKINMSEMVNHLIQAEYGPIGHRLDIVETPQISRPRLDAINNEVNDEIH